MENARGAAASPLTVPEPFACSAMRQPAVFVDPLLRIAAPSNRGAAGATVASAKAQNRASIQVRMPRTSRKEEEPSQSLRAGRALFRYLGRRFSVQKEL